MKNKIKKSRVFAAMSGGVDSSVAALLLKQAGYEVIGVFLRCYNVDGCAERDAEDARRVAGKLNIPFYVFNFEKEYKEKVVDYMIDGYRRGITPNPDVMCNKEIKFGLFLKKALEMGADYAATGHYVKIKNLKIKNQNDNSSGKIVYKLFEAKDKTKDQSYFLWTLNQERLGRCLFPIGDYLKSEVREMARRAGLPTADKKDSQGICFLGKVGLEEFLRNYIPEKRGEVLNVNGEKISEHRGAQFYTIGQRRLGIIQNSKLNIKQSAHRLPSYVIEKNIAANTLVVVEGNNNPALYKNEIDLTDINFIDQRPAIDNRGRVWARIRYRQPLSSAHLICRYKSLAAGCRLEFDQPVKFVAPGQSAVFYGEDGEMLGGGIIK